MSNKAHLLKSHTTCPDCKGQGKKRQRIRKKAKLEYERRLKHFAQNDKKAKKPVKPRGHLASCTICNGTGLIPAQAAPEVNTNYPHIAIVGGGIGGTALAVACLHRRIPFTLYERDENFEARSQGYGLTLQQASKAMAALGISNLEEGVVSTRHLVHTTDGTVIGEWGMRKWMESDAHKSPKRTNIHIARQSLRLALLEQLKDSKCIQWNHQFLDFKNSAPTGFELRFKTADTTKTTRADLIVGADGIRSRLRELVIKADQTPLRYLDCIVILGICPLAYLKDVDSDLLDGATVFQTANGHERIYMMPYDSKTVMWQLSYPLAERDAKIVCSKGAKALKKEACNRTQWHTPIPQVMEATPAENISGYPVYDRELLTPASFEAMGAITLLGDAAHPMSPFKGQGANQALLDALSLARAITRGCSPKNHWKDMGLRAAVLKNYEAEMLARSAIKVTDSAAAAQFLHSDIVLQKNNAPRGRYVKE